MKLLSFSLAFGVGAAFWDGLFSSSQPLSTHIAKSRDNSATQTPVVVFDSQGFGYDLNTVMKLEDRPKYFDYAYGPGREATLYASDFQDASSPVSFCQFLRAAMGIRVAKHCRVYNDNGELLDSYLSLLPNSNLWVMNEDRPFIWPSWEIGHKITLTLPSAKNDVVLETLAHEPKLYRLHNFVTDAEVDMLIQTAVSLKLERSTGGLAKKGNKGANKGTYSDRRTSTNAWDTNSKLALNIKRRTFELLRGPFETFDAEWMGGLQMVHYDPGQFYHSHQDWFDPKEMPKDEYNWDPSTGGANRFATLFIYLSDTELGGETVFPKAVTPAGWKSDVRGTQEEVDELKAALWPANHTGLEREEVDICRTKLAVKPTKGDAILFYLQDSVGHLDEKALHGACPVLKGEKWGANLWIWNGEPWNMGKHAKEEPEERRYAKFHNKFDQPGHIFWINPSNAFVDLNDEIKPGKIYESNTFEGHTFGFVIDGKLVSSWAIRPSKDEADQRYDLTPELNELAHLQVPDYVISDLAAKAKAKEEL